jgi:hypothetical protein
VVVVLGVTAKAHQKLLGQEVHVAVVGELIDQLARLRGIPTFAHRVAEGARESELNLVLGADRDFRFAAQGHEIDALEGRSVAGISSHRLAQKAPQRAIGSESPSSHPSARGCA